MNIGMDDDCPNVIGGKHYTKGIKKSKVKRNFKIRGVVNKCQHAQYLYTVLTLHPWLTEELNIKWLDVSQVDLNKELGKKALDLLGILPLKISQTNDERL